jgi:hypothetical protein
VRNKALYLDIFCFRQKRELVEKRQAPFDPIMHNKKKEFRNHVKDVCGIAVHRHLSAYYSDKLKDHKKIRDDILKIIEDKESRWRNLVEFYRFFNFQGEGLHTV